MHCCLRHHAAPYLSVCPSVYPPIHPPPHPPPAIERLRQCGGLVHCCCSKARHAAAVGAVVVSRPARPRCLLLCPASRMHKARAGRAAIGCGACLCLVGLVAFVLTSAAVMLPTLRDLEPPIAVALPLNLTSGDAVARGNISTAEPARGDNDLGLVYYVLVGTDYDAFEYRVALAPNDAEVPRARPVAVDSDALSLIHSLARWLWLTGWLARLMADARTRV